MLASLHQTLENVNSVYLVVDALDECTERVEILDTLEEIVGWGLENLHILATSRMEKDIEEVFSHMGCQQFHLEGPEILEDIQQYVHRRMLRERWLRKWPEETWSEIASVVTTNAGPMFRLAALQLDELKKGHPQTVSSLNETLSLLPTSLEETYARVLNSIDRRRVQDAIKIVHWLCFAFQPPTVEELAEALSIDLDTGQCDPARRLQDPDAILAICGSLVTRSSDGTGALRLSHLTVKEYLTSTQIEERMGSQFYVTTKESDIYIAKTCLYYLGGRAYRSRNETQNSFSNDTLSRYAVNFWPEYFKRCEGDPGMMSLAEDLLLKDNLRFLDWAWLSSITPDGFYVETPK